LQTARHIAERFATLAPVEAVALTGSQMSGTADDASDVDLYVYIRADIPVAERMALAAPYAEGAEFDIRFWGTEDAWYDLDSGIKVEAIYWWVGWIEDQLERVLRRHEASTGYSTAFWYSVRGGHILFDRNGWLQQLQVAAQQPYPEALRRAIIAKNHPILRRVSSSYLQQIEVALRRNDVVSLNHRMAALLASYFDILFALNRQPHPGEKRLIHYAERLCDQRPPALRQQIEALVASLANGDVIARANDLIDGLDSLLTAEGFDLTSI
jgi:predicted nucleotidyltransferase